MTYNVFAGTLNLAQSINQCWWSTVWKRLKTTGLEIAVKIVILWCNCCCCCW